jgi:hypothetical protein
MNPWSDGVSARIASSEADLAAANHCYERHGFVEFGAFYPPSSDIPVTTMWRDAR